MPSYAQLAEPGTHAVDTSVTCNLTRFRLRSPLGALATYRDFSALRDAIAHDPPSSLMRSAFVFENPTTCFSVSIWDAPPRFPDDDHIRAARRVFGRLSKDSAGAMEIWSTKWRLAEVSGNLSWDGFDLRSHLSERR